MNGYEPYFTGAVWQWWRRTLEESPPHTPHEFVPEAVYERLNRPAITPLDIFRNYATREEALQDLARAMQGAG